MGAGNVLSVGRECDACYKHTNTLRIALFPICVWYFHKNGMQCGVDDERAVRDRQRVATCSSVGEALGVQRSVLFLWNLERVSAKLPFGETEVARVHPSGFGEGS